MAVIRIDDPADPRLAPYAGVREPARLREAGLLIAEGRLVVRRLLASGRVPFASLLVNDAAHAALGDAIAAAPSHLDVFVAPPAVITAATGFNIHRGCLAVAPRPADPPMDALLEACDMIVVLERVVDPDNIGSVFRNADAFGAHAVLLSPGCGDPFYRKALRTSSGAALLVPSAAAGPWPQAIDRIRAAGFIVAALTPEAGAIDIGGFVAGPAARGRLALLLGSEGTGLSFEALARADLRVRIPIESGVDSLNIATTAGIALHRVRDARRAARRP